MAPALTSVAPTAPHELTKKIPNNNAPKNIFPDGIKTSGQHDPLYDQLRPYSNFPKEITGVCCKSIITSQHSTDESQSTAWDRDEYKSNPERWTHPFSEEEIKEISDAADAFISSGTPLTGITKEKFQLPQFSQFLEPLRKELIDGKGFIRLSFAVSTELVEEAIRRIGPWLAARALMGAGSAADLG